MVNRQFPKRRILWFERFMALAATLNLSLIVFDLSYIHWRDFYFRRLPQITHTYDNIKGIEPHRETEYYLETIDLLQKQLNQTGLESPEVTTKLEEIRRLSSEMIDSNPFAAVGKSGSLERIKNRMRNRTRQKSAKFAFATFWSPEYLSKTNWNQEINFFNNQIRPYIATNYYRQIGENGDFIDKLWIIDSPFIILFALEFLARIFYIRRRHPGFSWFDAALWRWYDIFLLLPFWRLLRIIPVIIRLDKAQLLNFHPVRQQIHQGIVANFAEEMTEIIVVRVINQVQGSIRGGDFTRWLLQQENLRPYIDINNVNEVEAIAGLLVKTIVYQVLPKIQPEIVAILRHNIDKAFNQASIYRNLQLIPGVGEMQTQLSEQIATQIATSVYDALVASVEDPVSAKLSGELMQSFSQALGGEIQKRQVQKEIQTLLFEFLEEIKINYVQRLSDDDLDQILEQTRRLKTHSVQTVVPSPVLPPQENS